MKANDARIERFALALGILASVWFAFTAWWGEFQIPAGGHIGAGSAANCMLAEAQLQWHSIYPLFDWYADKDPYPIAANCHHPFGQYWLSAIALKLFGHRNFVPCLPAAILSTLTVPLLYKTAKRAWGPLAGAAAALGFAFLPITAGFSQFHNLEVIVIFGTALFFHGFLKYQETKRASDLALALVGAVFAVCGDWVGYLMLAPPLAWAFFRAFAVPGARPTRVYSKWWAWSVVVAVGSFAMWMALFKHADKLQDWLQSADTRAGSDVPLGKVLEERKHWIDFSFTPVAIAIGKFAAPIALFRLIVRRRDEELFSLAALFGATVQYVAFKRGADVHIFWPHYFGLYYAYALAQLVRTAGDVGGFVMRFIAPMRARTVATIASVVVLLVPTILVVPDGVRATKIWRATGGKYDDNGTLLRSHVDMLVIVDSIAHRVPHGQRVGYHPGANWGWEHIWALGGPSEQSGEPEPQQPFWFARASGLGAGGLRDVSKHFHLRIYGDTVLVTRGDPNTPLDAYSLDEHEPNIFQWMFVNNVEPVREVTTTPDEFFTWEWRYHLDQPATPPTRAPQTLEETRIAHNAAVARGDEAEANRLMTQLRGVLVRDVETQYDGDHELMGVRVTNGVKPMLEIWFRAGGPTQNDTTFGVRSSIVAKNPLSSIPIDTVDREMAWPPALSTKLWKRGFVYKFEAVMNHRIGLEKYVGSWRGGPRPKHHADAIELVSVR
ncbi:MAG TPA: glycosyltransferase family 39 protein [Polyangiaceae bacterium]|nr:glycosyltransferase family 39 protein [Polyangiaceae bacterium]